MTQNKLTTVKIEHVRSFNKAMFHDFDKSVGRKTAIDIALANGVSLPQVQLWIYERGGNEKV